jgi:HEAT repeat protein
MWVMITVRILLVACLLALLALLAMAASSAPAAEKPAATETPWGPPSAGLTVSLAVDGAVAVNGPMKITVSLQTVAGQAVALPQAKEAFGWLLVAQGTGATKKAFYSGTLAVFQDATAWPAELAAEKSLTSLPQDAGPAAAYKSEDARELLAAYLAAGQRPAKPLDALPAKIGELTGVLAPGRAMAKLTLCLPRAGGAPIILTSNSVELTVSPPDLAALSPEAQQAFLADLMKQFDRDAWSGQQAHDTAVRLGAAALPSLLVAAFEKDRPAHARLWLATALADIRDPQSAEALIKLLDDPQDGVQNVVAYHGPKQANPALDKAIIAKVQTAKNSGLAAWATLGFMVHRGQAPEELLKAGLESDDPRARAAVAEALAQHASPENVARLVALLADPDERVRGTAAAILGHSGNKAPAVLGGLIKALDLPGEAARQKIAAALLTLTGRALPYDPKSDDATRAKVIAAWKAWWAAGKP